MKLPLRFLCSALLGLIFFASTSAQSDTSTVKLDAGNGGRNTLQGDIVIPGGQRLDRPVIVKLSTPRGEISTTSNSNGSFVFRQLVGGRYSVRVEAGEAYAPALEVVDIADSGSGGAMSRMGQTYTVQIYLRPSSGPPITKGVIAANEPPKAAVELYHKALESAKTGNRDKAIEQLKAALAIHPTFTAALNGLGVQYMKLGNHEAAVEAFGKALKLAPDNFILHLNRGICLFSLNKYAEAEAEFAAALLQNEISGVAHVYRARALIALNRLDDAAKNLKRAVEIGGDEVKIAHRFLAGIHIENGEPVEAVKQLELYLKAAPNSKESEQIKNLIKELRKKSGG
jgi:tetratricopeptide (TPR) repeat protein